MLLLTFLQLGRLQLLEELVLSENNIEDIPVTVASIPSLRVLKLQNNKIRALPYELAEVQTLEELDCSNNAELEMVPRLWRGDTESIMFVCKVHR